MFRGLLIDREGVRHGYLIAEECRFEESRVEYREYVFTPTFFNAHTHLGDAAFKEAPRIELEKLVAPGGYKHRMLSLTSINELRNAVKDEVAIAKRAGTLHFLDFRESGKKGLEVVSGIDGVLPLARPGSVEEGEEIIDYALGFAMSSTRDHDAELLEELRRIARREGKIFAIHAGEVDCGDVEAALTLEPDLIVHMNACSEKLNAVFDAAIPLVSCIRSNAFFGLLNRKSYERMKDYELWMLGSDNAMIASASMLEEMHFAAYIVSDDAAVFEAATRGSEVFSQRSGYIVFHRRLNLKRSGDFLATIVRRATPADIELIIEPRSR